MGYAKFGARLTCGMLRAHPQTSKLNWSSTSVLHDPESGLGFLPGIVNWHTLPVN